MTITINGSGPVAGVTTLGMTSGTITGLSAGGLPDATVLPADLSTGAPSWDSSGNLSFNSGYGSTAKAYGCRAWVNFNGTGTVAIRASGNVSSITDNGTGDYTINFATALPDANYTVATIGTQSANYVSALADVYVAPQSGLFRVTTQTGGFVWNDTPYGQYAVFR